MHKAWQDLRSEMLSGRFVSINASSYHSYNKMFRFFETRLVINNIQIDPTIASSSQVTHLQSTASTSNR